MFNFFKKKPKSREELLADFIIERIEAVGCGDDVITYGTSTIEWADKEYNIRLQVSRSTSNYFPSIILEGEYVSFNYDLSKKIGEVFKQKYLQRLEEYANARKAEHQTKIDKFLKKLNK